MRKFKARNPGNGGAEYEAVQLNKENVEEVAVWCSGTIVEEIDALDSTKRYVGINLTVWDGGPARLSEGDYLIKDSLGEFIVRWAANFEQQFEAVD